MDLKEHAFVVFSEEHYNPLGVIRSLGESGLKPVAIIVKGGPLLTSKSKYLSAVGQQFESWRMKELSSIRR